VFTFLLNFAFSQHSKAQDEISLLYGGASMEQFSVLIRKSVSGTTIRGIYNENVISTEGSFIGPAMLQFRRSFNNSRFTLGGVFGYSQANTRAVYENKPNLKYKVDVSFFMIMAQTEYKYFENDNFSFYSGVALGVDIISPSGSDTKGNPNETSLGSAFQLTPAGLKFVSRKIGGCIESGWGSKGIINGGIIIRL
jgi:hypothetical protein